MGNSNSGNSNSGNSCSVKGYSCTVIRDGDHGYRYCSKDDRSSVGPWSAYQVQTNNGPWESRVVFPDSRDSSPRASCTRGTNSSLCTTPTFESISMKNSKETTSHSTSNTHSFSATYSTSTLSTVKVENETLSSNGNSNGNSNGTSNGISNGTSNGTSNGSVMATLAQTRMKIRDKLSALKNPGFRLRMPKLSVETLADDNVLVITELAKQCREKAILSAAQWACAKDFTAGCRVLRRHVQPKAHGNALVLIADFNQNYEQIFHNPGYSYAKGSLEQVESNYTTIYRPLNNISQMYDELDNETQDRGNISLLVIVGHGDYSGVYGKNSLVLSPLIPFPDRPSLKQIEANGSIVILSCYAGIRLAPAIKKHTLPSVKVYSSTAAVSNFVQDEQGFYFESSFQRPEGLTRIDHDGVNYR